MKARGLTVRSRILIVVVVLTAIALAGAGVAAYAVEMRRIDSRIDELLERGAAELEQLLEAGRHPTTGEPFETPEDVVAAAIQLKVPATHEGVLGLREMQAPLVSGQSQPIRLEGDAKLLEAGQQLLVGDSAVITSVSTPLADYRILVYPIHDAPDATEAHPSAALLLAVDRGAWRGEFSEVARIYVLIAVVSLAVIWLLAWLLAGRLLRPVRTLAATARIISESDFSDRIPVVGNDDMAAMTEAVNTMLDRLEGSFEDQRRLIDDVGHELRTPLTIIRGHLELMNPHDNADAATVREIALGELDRMNLLVDDLLTLATVESPGFLVFGPVDLGPFTKDLLDRARPLGARTWILEAVADATVVLDARRLSQAWLQLVANAVKFSEPGTAVSIGSAVEDGQVLLWVTDQGRGIPADEHERIFERFGRADGTQAVVGSGLGLPIVQAIASAHGGGVTVDSTVGQGSTFTIAIPSVTAEEPS